MSDIIIIRIGELYLKGKNRSHFESILKDTIRKKLKDIKCAVNFNRNRYTVSGYDKSEENQILAILKNIFGINSLSVAIKCNSDLDSIVHTMSDIIPKNCTFRVNINRADKTFPYTSPAAASIIGARLLEKHEGLKVDLHNPDCIIQADIRENGVTYVFSTRIKAVGGMPVGSAAPGLLLLSGGIDSPVAGYMMAKRGVLLDYIHFHSYPYTSEMAKEKVKTLAKLMQTYTLSTNLIMVPFTEIQEEIHKKCNEKYMITVMRRFMMRVAERISIDRGLKCIITGESLGQVASQTVESLTVTNNAVNSIPVLRPLIGFDKQDILNIAIEIGTYKTSILPYEDCCTVFLPDSPVIRPALERTIFEESKIENSEDLIIKALKNIEIITIE